MKILVVSDTHGRRENFRAAVFKEQPFDMLIHCGDVEGDEDYISEMAECEVKIVAGNNDFFCDLPRELEVDVCGHHIFMAHGHTYNVSVGTQYFREEAEYRGADIAIFGHIHRPVMQKDGELLVLNPGSLSYPRQEGRNPSYIILELEEGKAPKVSIQYL